MRVLLLLLTSILVFGCPKSKDDPADTDGGDATPCERMCTHFRALECAEGDDFYDSDVSGPVGVPNTTCEEFCESQMTLGVDLNVECAAKAPTCEEIEAYRAMQSCD